MLRVRHLGRVPYLEADVLQRSLAARGRDDYLLVLEHDHVYTLGVRADPAHVLADPETVGATLVHTDRGGDVTYHGPGQLVVYPVLTVPDHPGAGRAHVEWLERCTIDALADLGLHERLGGVGLLDGYPGVWVGVDQDRPRKLAAIGVRTLRTGVPPRRRTIHGIALNVSPDLSMFGHIVPCGIAELPVTSLAAEGVAVSMAEVADALVARMAASRAEVPETAAVSHRSANRDAAAVSTRRNANRDAGAASRRSADRDAGLETAAAPRLGADQDAASVPPRLAGRDGRHSASSAPATAQPVRLIRRNEEPTATGAAPAPVRSRPARSEPAGRGQPAGTAEPAAFRRLRQAGVDPDAGLPLRSRKPEWLRVPVRIGQEYRALDRTLRRLDLVTVCEEAGCPNIYECWSEGTATFMVNGDRCTRACGFCQVDTRKPLPLDPGEPARVAEAVAAMDLAHAVVTCVARDDLPDGGAGAIATTIDAIRARCPGTAVEVLISDCRGDSPSLERIFRARPDVLNHNVETVARLQRAVRPSAGYARSLAVLGAAVDTGLVVKSGCMVGLGETRAEVEGLLADLANVGVSIVTIGQYLRPSAAHLPVARWWTPEELDELRVIGTELGLAHVEASPLTRSSYHARRAHDAVAGHQPAPAVGSAAIA